MKIAIFLTNGRVTSVQTDEPVEDVLVVLNELCAYRPDRCVCPCVVQLVYEDLGGYTRENIEEEPEENDINDPGYAADERVIRQQMAARPLGVG